MYSFGEVYREVANQNQSSIEEVYSEMLHAIQQISNPDYFAYTGESLSPDVFLLLCIKKLCSTKKL